MQSQEKWLTVGYNRPYWVKDEDSELADLIFVADFHNMQGISHRRAMLSQAMYSSGSEDDPKS